MKRGKYFKMYNRLHQPFMKEFGVSLMAFWDHANGINIKDFDAWLQTPKGSSTADVVYKKHGEAGVKLICEILEIRPDDWDEIIATAKEVAEE